MATPDDDQVAAILAEMRDSQAPALSPIKSPMKRASSDSEDDIPSSQPAPKRPRTDEGFNTLRNRIAHLETSRAKAKKSLCVLKEHVSKSSCPVGLQYRPRPHLRPDQNFTTDMRKICQQAEQDLLKLMIQQQEKNVSNDTEAINALKKKLTNMIPDQTKREQAEKRIRSATDRANIRANKHRRASRQPNKANDINFLKAKISELTTLVNAFSKRENKKERVAMYSNVWFTDSSRAKPVRTQTISQKRSSKRKALRNQYNNNLRTTNEKFIKNMSNKNLTDQETALLAKGLKFIPTPKKPASQRNLLRDFNSFARSMRLKYIFADSKSNPHPFYVRSNWQPPPQPSVALENYLEQTKLEIANITFTDVKDNLSAKERQALKTLKNKNELNLKKADKGTTTVVMDTPKKIKEGFEQVSNDKFYKPLEEPIVSQTAAKVKTIVNTLFADGHIDKMTYKWLNLGQSPPRVPEFYTLTKIHKPTPVGRPIVSGSGGPTERISSFVDSLLQPIAKKQESYIKDTTHFINFIENNPLPEDAILVTLDVSSLYTNIPQEEGINIVCRYYEEHYQLKQPIPTTLLGELIRLILKENSFKFNDKHYLQTFGVAMGTKMAVAFAVIFMAHIEKQLLLASPQKPIFWKRFIDDIFSVWTLPEKEINNFVDFANSFHATIKFTHEMSSEKIVFLDTEVFKGPRFADRKTLDVQTHFKPTETFQYTHFSSSHPLSVKKGFIKGEALRLLRTNSVKEIFELRKLEFLTRLLERGYPRELAEKILAEVKFSSRNGALRNKTKTSNNVLPFVTTFNPSTPNLKNVLMKHWHLITENNRLGQIYSKPPIVAYRKDKSLKDLLVRAKIPSHI